MSSDWPWFEREWRFDVPSSKLPEIVERLRGTLRRALVDQLDGLDEEAWGAASIHPRLRASMRTVDLCVFVADHDDFHLARIAALR